MNELTTTGLRVVLAVARSGSFSAAATALGYTQSAVSRQVAAVERTIGGPAFERHPRGVRLTAAGEVLLRHASRIVDALDVADQELTGLRDRLAGRLVVGAFPTACAVLVPQAIAALRRRHPGIVVEVLEGSSQRQVRAVRSGRAAVGVVATGRGLPDLDVAGLRLERLDVGRGAGVAVAEGHPLAVRSWVAPEDLIDQPWIVGAADDGPQFGAWPALSQSRVAHTAKDWTTRLGLVRAGLGIALLPGLAAEIVPQGVRWLPVRDAGGGLGRRLALVTRSPSSPLADALAGLLRERAAALTEEPTAS